MAKSPKAAPANPVRDSVSGAFTMSGQGASNWCWAATTQSVMAFLNRGNLSQEDIVRRHIQASHRPYTCNAPHDPHTGGGHCDVNGCTAECNDLHAIDMALNGEGVAVTALSIDAVPDFQDIKNQITARRRPIPCHVAWPTGGGHIVVISGWSTASGFEEVEIFDPNSVAAGAPVMPLPTAYEDLFESYSSGGRTGGITLSYALP